MPIVKKIWMPVHLALSYRLQYLGRSFFIFTVDLEYINFSDILGPSVSRLAGIQG